MIVASRQLVEILAHRRALLRHPDHAGGGILDAGDVLQFEQPLHGIDRHVDHRARRDVVDDDRNADRIVDRLEVLVEALLGRLVVVGRHHQHGIRACLFGMLSEFDRFLGGIRAGARDHGHPPFGLGDAPLDDLLMLVMAERRALTGGADRHQAMDAARDLALDQRHEGFLVDLPVLERRDEGWNDALERGMDHDLQIAVRLAPRRLRQDEGGGQYVPAPPSRNRARRGWSGLIGRGPRVKSRQPSFKHNPA